MDKDSFFRYIEREIIQNTKKIPINKVFALSGCCIFISGQAEKARKKAFHMSDIPIRFWNILGR